MKPVPQINVISFADPASFCSPVAVSFDGSSTLGADSLIWNFGGSSADTTIGFNQLFSRTFTNNTASAQTRTVKVLAISAGGCRDSLTESYTIQPQIKAAFSLNNISSCSPLVLTPTNLSNQTGNSNGAATSFTWLINGVNAFLPRNPTAQTRVNPSNNVVVTENWQLVASNGVCIDTSAVQTTQILPNPNAVIDEETVSGCSPYEATFTATGSQAISGATSYQWLSREVGMTVFNSFDNTTSANDTARLPLVNNGIATQQYETKLLIADANGCQDSTFYSPVIVFPDIRPTFTVSDTIGCSPLVINLTNTTVAGGGASFFWTMNGSPILSTTQTLTNPSFTDTLVFVISLRVSANGCEKTVSRNIYVKPTPKAGFVSSADPASFCSPVAVSFDGSSTLGADSLIWNFGGSSADTTIGFNQLFSRTFTNNTASAQTRTVKVLAISAGGCRDSLTESYTVQPQIKAAFSLNNISSCSPLVLTPTNLSNQAGNSNGAATSFTWLINGVNAFLPQNPTAQTRVNPSNNVVVTENWQLVASNGVCIDTSAVQTTTILPNPRAAIKGLTVSGCSPYEAKLHANGSQTVNAGSGQAGNYRWFSRLVGNSLFVPFDTTALANDTARLPLVNNSTSTNQYETKLLLTDANGCQDSTFYSPVIVFPDIRPTFTVSDTIGCSPLVINLTNTTVAGGGASFFWTMNGSPILSTTQTLTNPSFTDTLVFVISLRVSANGCEKTVSRNIYVKPTPKAGFVSSADPASFCSPVTVSFDGSSTLGADSLIWNFGGSSADTTIGFNQVFSRTFANNTASAQTRTVNVLAVSAGGCRDSVTQSFTIQPQIKAAFSLSDTVSCSPLVLTPVNLSNQAGNSNGAATSFTWLINGVNAFLPQNPTAQTRVNPSNNVVITENWQLVASNGVCIDTSAVQTTTILPNPRAAIKGLTVSGCSPYEAKLHANGSQTVNTGSGNAGNYRWFSRLVGNSLFAPFDTTAWPTTRPACLW